MVEIEAAALDADPVDTDACARRLECLKLAGSHVGMHGSGKNNVEDIARRYVKFIERGKFDSE